MFAFLEKHKKIILTSVIIILAALALFTSGKKANATWLESALGFVITPIQDVTSGVGNWVDNTLTNRREQSEIVAENEALRKQVASLQSDINRLQKYETENARLSSLLRIAQKYPQYDSFGTTIIAKNPGSWYDVFTIDKGTTDGVKSNMVLCSAEGLVGKVLESGATYAKGQSILDSRSSVPAMSLRTEDLGVVKGDYTLMNDGLCKMEYVDAEAEIAVGDEIVTSHLSDIYPPGLTIGKVKEIKNDTNGLTKYAIIEPAVDLKHLDTLLVMDNSATQNQSAASVQTEQTEQTEQTQNTDQIDQTTEQNTDQNTDQTSDMAPEEETP